MILQRNIGTLIFQVKDLSVAFFDSDDVISQLLSMSDLENPTPGRSLQLIDN